ncbi:MAG: FtsX-like permease family protein [Dehalococcoidia bacterium]
MNELFGLSMTTIAGICLALTAIILAFVGFIAVRNPVMFKTGLRNIPRRPAQTALIVVGLMLSTLIVAAAFGTGDTLTHSITSETYTILGPVDEIIDWDVEKNPAPTEKQVVPLETVDKLADQFSGDVAGFVAVVQEQLPLVNTRTRLNQADLRVVAFREGDLDPFGGLKDKDGRAFTLADGEIALNRELAKEVDAKVGDPVVLIYEGEQLPFTVKAITANTFFGGTGGTDQREGAVVGFDFLSKLVGREGTADAVLVSNDGTTRGGLDRSDEVEVLVGRALLGTPYEIETTKKDSIRFAELLGNVFTSAFVIFGLFSIAAGILLIFLIFIMLAAERKPEMGMARAVGAKRRQIVESFLAEGMGYDLGAAVLGLGAGVLTSLAMVSFVKYRIGDGLGLQLDFNVTARSLIVSFCLGVIVTFIVVFLASWRASRLNIVAAIRDLPESKPSDPEGATVFGYLRAALNGVAAFGALVSVLILLLWQPAIGLIYLVLGGILLPLAGPWIGMLRGHNFGAAKADRKVGDPLPKWPFWVGGITLVLGVGAIILVGYAIAILVTRLVRDRKPSSVPVWLVVAGIVVPAIGIILVALQDRARHVAWNVGSACAGLLIAIVMMAWGLEADLMAPFAVGLSLVALWAAITLTYFHVPARPVFTIASAVLMVLWYALPGGRLQSITGELNADAEMFFVTGLALITAGTFIVVYNADILLPAVGRLGARLGRVYPAVKMAIAYPLTSRFRTGLTISMIGLIMFVLSMNAALNTNFDKLFLGDDALGGFDVRVAVNGNNRVEDLRAALAAGATGLDAASAADPAKIAAAGEARIAFGFEVDIEDPYWDAANDDPEDQYKHLFVQGVDQEFATTQRIPLLFRAAGYETDADVWAALASNPSFAIIPSLVTSGDGGFGSGTEDPLTLPEEQTFAAFKPFVLKLLNRTTGTLTEVTVIGQSADSASNFWPGLIVQKDLVERTFPDATGQEFYLALADGVDPERYAKQVEATLLQVEAESLQDIIDENQAISQTFLEMFQGFLALGLLVGIAALGVISFRAVVERRQQIGMLRAIGYKRSMVQLSFLLESLFIALSGIILGLILGVSFAATLFTSGEFGEAAKGVQFSVPWSQIGIMVGFALVMTAIMTFVPARQASRVAVAEALRYE